MRKIDNARHDGASTDAARKAAAHVAETAGDSVHRIHRKDECMMRSFITLAITGKVVFKLASGSLASLAGKTVDSTARLTDPGHFIYELMD
jgi:hypothetical protein